jgi:hypothetical protein
MSKEAMLELFPGAGMVFACLEGLVVIHLLSRTRVRHALFVLNNKVCHDYHLIL